MGELVETLMKKEITQNKNSRSGKGRPFCNEKGLFERLKDRGTKSETT